ncbi:MAG: hypothetical protein EP319_01875 [Deltaproteobacteria bacterium]|nr:MAG: hypothetical protein EP319_01875 [Deltaproteobacteria bacterium]
MNFLISTTKNQPPTASLFRQTAVELGHEVEFWFPEEEPLGTRDFDNFLCFYTALNYDDSDLTQAIEALNSHPFNFLNHPASLLKVRGKDKQGDLFKSLSLPYIPSLILEGDPMVKSELVKNLFDFAGKIIIKPFRGNKGIGVSIYENLSLVEKRLQDDFLRSDQRWLIQPWMENTGEVRVLFYDNNPLLAFRKKSAEGSFLNNLGQGSMIEDIATNQVDRNLLEMCSKIAGHTGLRYFAADFLETENGPVCLEVNTSPGLIYTSKFYKRNLAKEILEHEIKK